MSEYNQVIKNTTDIDWMKKQLLEMRESMQAQTRVLYGILISIIGGIVTLITLAPK